MAAKAPASRKTQLRPTLVKSWKIPGVDEPFTQDPLSFFEKNEFFALIARMIEGSLAGGAELDVVLSLVGMSDDNVAKIRRGEVDASMLPPIDSLVSVITRLISSTPEVLEETFMLALSIPPERQAEVRPHLRKIDDRTGFGIMETFLDQNSATLVEFFGRWRDLATSMAQTVRSTTSTPDSSPTLSA
jgi:hypothetical protein